MEVRILPSYKLPMLLTLGRLRQAFVDNGILQIIAWCLAKKAAFMVRQSVAKLILYCAGGCL